MRRHYFLYSITNFPLLGKIVILQSKQKQKKPLVSRGHSNSFNKSFFFWFLRLSKETPYPFPKQTQTKTNAGSYNGHNLALLRKKKKCLNIKPLFETRIRIMTYCCCDTFPLFSKRHLSHQSSSHQVHPRFHAQRGVLSPCAFYSCPVPFVA